MPPIIPLVFQGIEKILVIDPSASHLAYCIIKIDMDSKEAVFETCGMLWTKASWSKGQRFSYMRKALIELLNGVYGAYTEAFFSNPKMMFGSAVIPTINGIIEMSCYEQSAEIPIGYAEISPTLWRSQLGIKPNRDAKGKRDYKIPTKNKVEEVLGPLPQTIISNMTDKERELPYDISDALAISLAILLSLNCKVKNKDCSFIQNNVILKDIKEKTK